MTGYRYCQIASYLISTSNHNIRMSFTPPRKLLLISFLHQTTTHLHHIYLHPYCFLSHFYIKPQRLYGQTTSHDDCFLSHFYIKPQQPTGTACAAMIASYLISTSNHNRLLMERGEEKLLLISFLHQTTTRVCACTGGRALLLISFLHQTTTVAIVGEYPLRLLLISFLHQTTTQWRVN